MLKVLVITACVISCCYGWMPVGQRDTDIKYDIGAAPIQIKTNSAVGSRDLMWIQFLNEQQSGAGLAVEFTDPPTYDIGWCSGDIAFTMPEGNERIWTITKTETSLALHCNEVEIFNYKFSDSSKKGCAPQWTLDMTTIRFASSVNGIDTASEEYRENPVQGWTPAGKRNTDIKHDLQAAPIQIKTNSVVGSKDLLWIQFVNEQQSGAGISVVFTDPPTYDIGFCRDDTTFTMPKGNERIWTIVKTETSLALHCNGVEIFNYKFSDYKYTSSRYKECVAQWTVHMTTMRFVSNGYGTDKASAEYRSNPEVWMPAGQRNTNIKYDLQAAPLQIKTNSVVGSRDLMWIRFEARWKAGAGLSVVFTDPPTYEIGYCSDDTTFTMPKGNERIWSITKTKTSLKLHCNGFEIFNYKFSNSPKYFRCVDQWTVDTNTMRFASTVKGGDTASDAYRENPFAREFLTTG